MLFNNHSFYPIIKTDVFRKTVDFYCDCFDFHPTYNEDGFVILERDGLHKQYLGVMATDHKFMPTPLSNGRASDGQGPIINFYVENLRLAYQQFHWMEVDIISDIEHSDCGGKFLAIRDPNGNIAMVTEMPKTVSTATNEIEQSNHVAEDNNHNNHN